MRIPAASTGEGVPRPQFDAVIHSCFESALNLRLEAENRLITVFISEHYELPQGIRITSNPVPIKELPVGTPAAARGDMLSFGSFPLIVDLRAAPTWKCRVRDLCADMRSPASITSWSITWARLNLSQREKGADVVGDDLLAPRQGSILSRRLHEPILGLCSAAARLNLVDSASAARRLIGLGPGVTPAGDDILLGFLAGLWSTMDGHGLRLRFIRRLGQAVLELARETSEISSTYLWHAARGQFSSALSNLAEAISLGTRVADRIGDAIRVGHSSGTDSVTGLLLGFAVWAPGGLTRLHSAASWEYR